MPGGIKALRKIQFARNADSDSGAEIDATSLWRGTGTIEDARAIEFVAEDVGILAGTDRTNTPYLLGKLALDATVLTFEQFPNLLEMSVMAATPSSDTGSGWIRTYNVPYTAKNTLRDYTFEGGDNQQAELLDYVFCNDWTLAGQEKQAWMMSGNLIGRQVVDTTFTAGVSIPIVYNGNFGKSKLYINADSDAYGTTQISNTLLASNIKYSANLIDKHAANGNLYYSFVETPMPEFTLALTFEHDANAVTQKGLWRTEAARIIRLDIEGAALTSAGAYTYRTIRFDVPGKWLSFGKIGERNGNDVLEGVFHVRYNATKANAGSIVVVNDLTTLAT